VRAVILKFVLSVVIFYIVGCASTGATPIGSTTYSPLPENQEVVVFTDESQVEGEFDVIAIVSHSNPGKYQVLTLADAIPALKKKARQIGAEGIIIDSSSQVRSGIISRGIYVEARAIRIKKFEKD
jgi:hypothetical protein